jgi:hypothetical protein
VKIEINFNENMVFFISRMTEMEVSLYVSDLKSGRCGNTSKIKGIAGYCSNLVQVF